MHTIHSKLLAIQSELKAPKNQRNNFGGYQYRSCEDILEALKPLLKQHGLTLTLSDEIIFFPGSHLQAFTKKEFSKDGKQVIETTYPVGGDRFYVKATATITHESSEHEEERSLSASGWAREEQDKKGMDSSQITGAASSYARKYALNALFLIDDTKDADHTNDHGKAQEAKPQPAKKPAQAAGASSSIAPATQKQLEDIDRLCKETNSNLSNLKKVCKVSADIPTVQQAEVMIGELQKKLKLIEEKKTDLSPSAA